MTISYLSPWAVLVVAAVFVLSPLLNHGAVMIVGGATRKRARARHSARAWGRVRP